jgi:hypothetical protein
VPLVVVVVVIVVVSQNPRSRALSRPAVSVSAREAPHRGRIALNAGVYRVDHPAVVGDQQQGAGGRRVERGLQLFDPRQVDTRDRPSSWAIWRVKPICPALALA